MTTFLRQLTSLTTHFIRVELANLERLLSPILFSTTILILFFFAFSPMDQEVFVKVYIAQTFLSMFFALQIGFARIFEPDDQDDAFTLLRTYKPIPEAWFLSKYIVITLFGVLVISSTMGLSIFFNQSINISVASWSVFLVAILALLGIAALGLLLSAMMLKADAKQILYPLLYFPLTTPVLLAAVQCSQEILINNMSLSELLSSWLGLLLVFDAIYIILSTLLFGELVKSE